MTEELTIATTNKEIGRPMVVYGDDITEENKNKSKMNTEIRISKIRRLPGRDISISSDEDDEGDNSTILKPIEIIEDPTQKKYPRKSSMIVNRENTGKQGAAKKLEIVESKYLNETHLTTSSSASELSKTLKFQDLPSPANPQFVSTRKRSVSFLPSSPEPLGKKSEENAITKDSVDVPDGECLDECEEDEEVKSNTVSMNRLQVSVSARERRRSIETLFRPPTPPNACHSVKE